MRQNSSKGQLYCLISVLIIFSSYIIQKILHISYTITKEFAIVEAAVFSLAVCAVYFLVIKSNEIFYGILTAIFGFRMLPLDIAILKELSPEANMLYYVVQKVSLVIFALAIIKLYKHQQGNEKIKAVPILCLLIAVPYMTDTAATIGRFFTEKTHGNMRYEYFTAFLFYAIAMLVTFCIALKSDKINASLIINYQLVALIINAARRICAIAITLSNGRHISNSYYCWIAIYAVAFTAFVVLHKKKIREA